MTERKLLYMDQTEGYSVEMPTTDTATFGGLNVGATGINLGSAGKVFGLVAASSSGDAISYGQSSASLAGLTLTGSLAMGNNAITGLAGPSADTDAATKAYVDLLAVSGGRLKEALLDAVQIDNTNGILAAEVLYFAAIPTAGDTVIFKNAALTRTYTFVANQGAESADTDVSIETSDITAMQRLATRMNADATNTQWSGLYQTGANIGRINANGAIVVYEKASASGVSASRIYGVFTTPADAKVVQFASGTAPTVDTEYTRVVAVNMPAADPAYGRFGFRRQTSALQDCEIHIALDSQVLYAWDQDGAIWVTISGGAAIPDATSASGGATKGKVTFDSDYGLLVTGGIAKINITQTADPGLKFTQESSQGRLQVKADGTAGIQIGALGVAAKLDAAGAIVAAAGGGLKVKLEATNPTLAIDGSNQLGVKYPVGSALATGTTGLYVKLETTNPTLQVSTNDLGVKFDTSYGLVTSATGLRVALDSDTMAFNGSGQLTVTGGDIKKINVSEAVATGDPVYISGNSTVGKSDTEAPKAFSIGVSITTQGTVGQPASIVRDGVAAGVLSSATAGARYWVATGGGLTTTKPASGKRTVRVGYAFNTTDLFVSIADFGQAA